MNKTTAAEAEKPPERLYYRPREVAALTGMGLRTIYAGVYAGIIPSRKIGDARLIPAVWLLAKTDADAEEIRQALAPRRGAIPQRTGILWAKARAIREGFRVRCESRFRRKCECARALEMPAITL